MTLEEAIDKFFVVLSDLMDLHLAKDLLTERFLKLQAEMHERKFETRAIQADRDKKTRLYAELCHKYSSLRADLGAIHEIARQVVEGESKTSPMEALRRAAEWIKKIIDGMEGEE